MDKESSSSEIKATEFAKRVCVRFVPNKDKLNLFPSKDDYEVI